MKVRFQSDALAVKLVLSLTAGKLSPSGVATAVSIITADSTAAPSLFTLLIIIFLLKRLYTVVK